jgi:hypothetical protein
LFAYTGTVPKRRCLVLIPHAQGGLYDYDVEAASSMEAARIAPDQHRETVADDAVITVISDGHGLRTFDYVEHNARQPTYRHRAGAVQAVR